MRFSIIIPAYNVESFLPKCLNSILCENDVDYEVIVVNDGSTDGTLALLEDFAACFSHLRVISQVNQGMSTARNRGLAEATGDYVMFVDSDDWLCEGALPVLANKLKDEDVLCFNSMKYFEETGQCEKNVLPVVDEPISGWQYFNHRRLTPTTIHFVCIWQRIYKRSFLNEHDLRFADGILRAEDDLFTTMVMYYAATLRVIPEVLYVYRVRSSSITTTVDVNRWYDSLSVQEMLADFFIPLKGIDKKVIYQVLASNYINCFSEKTKSLYGNRVKELKMRINWGYFKETAMSRRHKRLFWIIKRSPTLYRICSRVISRF